MSRQGLLGRGHCLGYRTESVTPGMLDESWAVDWWPPRHEQKLSEKVASIAAGTPPKLVFIGDSITQGWEKDGLNVWRRHFAGHHALALGASQRKGLRNLATRHGAEVSAADEQRHRNVWAKYVMHSIVQHGLVPVWWDTGELIDRANGAVKNADTVNTIINARSGVTAADARQAP